MPPKKQRVSLTGAQIQAGLGAELLALCQSSTADGKLTKEEIIADGIVTKEELKELYTAIEKVLPPEIRREAVAQRKLVENEEKAQAKAERQAEKERERAEREARKQEEREEKQRQRPVYSMNFMVAGIAYEGRSAIVAKYAAEGDTVYLVRDPHNEYSRNAIEVRIANGMQIGFVPEEYAPDVAPLLDAGHPHKATVIKIIGYRYTIPVVQAYLYRADTDEPDVIFPDAVPSKSHSKTSSRQENEEDDYDQPEDDQSDARHWEELPRDRTRTRTTGKGCLILVPLLCVPASLAAARVFGLG